MSSPSPQRAEGLPQAIGAYVVWGLLPLYLILVHHVPAFEFVGWRVLFTLPVCLVLVAWQRQWTEMNAVLRQPRLLAALTASALLIGANWLIYIAAVQSGHVFASSIGYYINPLVNVVLGTAFLGERLTKRQWWAVGLAAAGVSILAIEALSSLWISLLLAGTFGLYGLVRKLVPVSSITGLTFESALLVAPALGIIGWYAATPAGISMGRDLATDGLVAVSGLITAIPLLLFAYAARRMDYSTIGFIQFLSPTIVFFLGLFVFKEALSLSQLVCFVIIWTACGVFCWDLIQRRRALQA